MTNDPAIHRRRSIRLPGYDYAQAGAYFITLVTHNRQTMFGEILNGEMRLNEMGEMVQFTWNDLINHVGGIELGEFVIMPNHIHGIVVIVGAGSEPALTEPAPSHTATSLKKPHPLSEIVRQLKTFSARRINEQRETRRNPVWQRNYYEHIIRDEKSYQTIAAYILNNPFQWELDSLYPGGTP